MSVEEEIARTLAEWWEDTPSPEAWRVETFREAAASLSPLLNRVRAEGFEAGWRSSGEGYNGEYPDEGVSWAESAGREAYARWIEQNSEVPSV